MSRLNNMITILAKAKQAGFFEDVKPAEVDQLEAFAKTLFSDDTAIHPKVTPAAAITSPTAPSATYVQAEAASAKAAIDSIRAALTAAGITL